MLTTKKWFTTWLCIMAVGMVALMNGQNVRPSVRGLDYVGTGGSGDPNAVTAAGTLTANLPVIGAGTKTVAVGTRTGNTTQFVSWTGAATAGKQLTLDANGNAIVSAFDVGASSGGSNPMNSAVNTGTDVLTLTANRTFQMQCGSAIHTVNSGETVTFTNPTGGGAANFIVYFNCSTAAWTLSSQVITGITPTDTTAQGVAVVVDATNGLKLPQCSINFIAGATNASNNFISPTADLWAGVQQGSYCILAGSNVTITPSGDNTFTIASSAGASVAPGGSGTELQVRSGASTFGAVTGSSSSGSNITIDGSITFGDNARGILNEDATGGYAQLKDASANNVYQRAKAGSDSALVEYSTNLTTPGMVIYPKGGIQFIPQNSGATPYTCNATQRSLLWVVQGASGTPDRVQLCMKKADDTYLWVVILTAP